MSQFCLPLALGIAAVALAACGGGSPETTASPTATATVEATPKATRTPGVNAQGVRYCAYVPGESEPTTMPAGALRAPSPTATPSRTPPSQTCVAPETTQRQQDVLSGIRDSVADNYVYPDFNGRDWQEIGDRYEALVAGGLTDADFYAAMQLMISELGDAHSYFQSPEQVAEDRAAIEQGQHFVGFGVLVSPIQGTQTGSIIVVFPGSPAEEAGLRPHDLLLEVDGLPYRDDKGRARSLGPEGTTFSLTYQHPGEAPQTINVTRRAVSGFLPVDYCMVPDTRIGYILLPTLLDESIDDQVRTALQRMTADGPLDGLIVDNRQNGGGLGSVTESTLAFFATGTQGSFVSSDGERPLDITPEDVGGSQAVPMIVLAGPDTVSFGEIFTGVLQLAGRASVIGSRTAGNVETLHSYDYPDGSRAWLATETFAPEGLEAGAWEGKGVSPDVSVPTRWDLFKEATDPALARAVEELQ